eukprot:COSAG05_NODE_4201_length_1626_cov_2.167649_1_plen_347_part_01
MDTSVVGLVRTASANERLRPAQLRCEAMEPERQTRATDTELRATVAAIGKLGGGQIFDSSAPPVSPLIFGSELSHPITVLAADFDCCVLPQHEGALVRATLTVSNEHVHGDKVKATLRFPLPDGATVCGFQFQIGAQLVDAFAVTKKKAAAVAYKEKEKGRSVATTEAVQGNVWSTEIFPLPRGETRIIVLTFVCGCPCTNGGSDPSWGFHLPLSFSSPVALVTGRVTIPSAGLELLPSGATAPAAEHYSWEDNINGEARETILEDGFVVSILRHSPAQPHVVTASCPVTGLQHFSVTVPADAIEAALGPATISPGPREGQLGESVSVSVVWDTSGSCSEGAGTAQN